MPDELLSLADTQAGALSHTQIVRAGVTDDVLPRLVRTGVLRRVARGVYTMGPDSWEQQVWAGLLIGGRHAVIGGRAAALLWKLSLDKPCRNASEPPIDVYVGTSHSTLRSTNRWHFIRNDRVGVSEPRRTSIAQTIVDLAQTMTGDQLASVVGQTRRWVTAQQIIQVLDQTPRHRQRALLRDVVADVDDGATSPLERRYVHDVERAHGLPHALRQAKPISLFTVDNLYDPYDIIVELDSAAYHRGVAAAQDLNRDQLHRQSGFDTLRYTWTDVVDHPCRTARYVAEALSGRGWTGTLTTCPKCRGTHG
jgi:very-short-patch-repair endonuclease